MNNFLLISADPEYGRWLRDFLTAEFGASYQLHVTSTVTSASTVLATGTPSCILLALGPPEAPGIEALGEVLAMAPAASIVVLVDAENEALGQQAVTFGAQDFLVKGKTDSRFLIHSIRSATDRSKTDVASRDRVHAARTHQYKRSLVPIFIALAVTLSAVLCGSWYWNARNSSDAKAKVALQSFRDSDQMTSLLARYGRLVSGAGELVRLGITRPQYRSYLRSVGFGTSDYPGVIGVGIVQRVGYAQVPGFLAGLRADGHVNPTITPAGQRDHYCLGSYAEWTNLKVQVPLFGYDLCTVPKVATVLARATGNGNQEVVLGSSLAKNYASDLLLVRAIYSGNPTNEVQRTQQVIGWSLAIIDQNAMFDSIDRTLGLPADDEIGLYHQVGGVMALVAKSDQFGQVHGTPTITHWINAYGRWGVLDRSTPGAPIGGSPIGPLLFLGLGLICVAMLAALLASISRSRARAALAVEAALQSLHISERRFKALADAAPIGIVEASPYASIEFANARLAEICGRELEELVGRNWVDIIHPDDLPKLMGLIEDIRVSRAHRASIFRIVHPDGEVRKVRLLAAPMGDTIGSGFVVTVEDITDEMRAHEALEHQALHDPLTGLPNRTLFIERLTQDMARNSRSEQKLAVLFLDLDQFKIVNDSLGHLTGDAVLQNVADRFMQSMRAGETVCRLGGDEFTFIIQDVDDVRDAEAAAARLMEVLRNPIHIGGRDLTVTASIGIVVAGGAYRGDAESVLRDADTAMYRAKESGRNRFVAFEADFHSRTINRLSMETELRDGLNLKQFEVYYQPVVDPRNGQPVGAEALVRWHHPTRGMVSPSEFIPVAEETALIVPLGEWVFSTALTQLGEWDNAADGPSLDSLAVNVSARQLDDPAAISAMMRLLEQHSIDPVRFSVEVTESAVMVESETTRRSLFDLKEFGLRVSIDDFGTGYSSLAYLHTLPVTTVKVDRSFVKRMGTAEDSTPVVRAIVDMSHALGLDVVAEGVSSEELRHRVVLTRCDRAQGYLWAKPMPAAEFAAWWRAANQLALVGVR